MFYCFAVIPEDRNYMRFLWHRGHNFEEPILEYRMKVHVFRNRPSPAVATYGLHRTALVADETFRTDVKDFVLNNFYVDDGLISVHVSEDAIDLLKRTQMTHGYFRLDKFACSWQAVTAQFPTKDLTKSLVDLEQSSGDLPLQQSLGLY
jgi:hypothetical protein